MFSIKDRPSRLCDGWSRRELLRAGGLSLLGLGLPRLLEAREAAPLGAPPIAKSFAAAKNVIFLYLAGGPPQHETFDPKPAAPAEIRGPFQPVQTTIPGVNYCELLPRTSQLADKLAIVRSMSTNDNTHSSSSAWVLTGYKYQGPNARTIQANDWPYFGSIVKQLKPSESLPPLSTVWLPDMMRLNENVTPAGQTGGFLGSQWDPDRFIGDPSQPDYSVEGLQLSSVPPMRLKRRRALLGQVERHFNALQRGQAARLYEGYKQQAFELMTSGKAQEAFAIQKEPDNIRDRYGRSRWGQCVLLARRLIEAGVRLVHVQWPREDGDNAVDNPLWDTHAQNADRLEDVLCPQFDVGFSALVEDLDQRGLLDETLVVAIGEFGRTPKINAKGGRDHWGPVFSCALAGAGISGGQVFGASDKDGAYPAEDRVEPGDLTATIFHLLGIPHTATFHDREGREHRVTSKEPIYKLLGERPATDARVTCTANVARVPPFDEKRILVDADFDAGTPIRTFDAPSRPKGWRATPQVVGRKQHGVGVRELPGDKTSNRDLSLGLFTGERGLAIKKGGLIGIAQEVRSPFAGRYVLQADVRAEATSEQLYRALLANFKFRLEFFEYQSAAKKPDSRKQLASVEIELPQTFANKAESEQAFERIKLSKEFLNPKAGANFSFGLGMGVALLMEKFTEGELTVPAESGSAALRVRRIALQFIGKPRNNDVVV